MDIGVGFLVETCQGVDDSLRLLGGSAVIQVRQTAASHLLRQDRKIRSVHGNVLENGFGGVHAAASWVISPGNMVRTADSMRLRRVPFSIRTTDAAANASSRCRKRRGEGKDANVRVAFGGSARIRQKKTQIITK